MKFDVKSGNFYWVIIVGAQLPRSALKFELRRYYCISLYLIHIHLFIGPMILSSAKNYMKHDILF